MGHSGRFLTVSATSKLIKKMKTDGPTRMRRLWRRLSGSRTIWSWRKKFLPKKSSFLDRATSIDFTRERCTSALPMEVWHKPTHGLLLYRFGIRACTCTGVLAESAQVFSVQGLAASSVLGPHAAPSFHKRRWSRVFVSPHTFVC